MNHASGPFPEAPSPPCRSPKAVAVGQLRLGASLFDVVYLCWPFQKRCDASQNLFHLYAIVHALRNAKMYNKSFF